MNPKNMKSIDIELPGIHYIVPENDLNAIIRPVSNDNRLNWVFEILDIPQWGDFSLGFLILHHRSIKNMSQRELGEKIGKDHKYVARLESSKKKKIKKTLLTMLISTFGEKFEKGVELLRTEIIDDSNGAENN